MVSPFAAWEDDKRRRWRIALGIAPNAPPDRVDALIADMEARGLTPPAVAAPQAAAAGDNPFSAFLHRASATLRRPEPPPNAGLIDRLLPGFRSLSTPALPEAATAVVPARFQPAARAVRELTSPLSLVTLPLGGAKIAALGAAGFIGGAQAGSEIGGPTGELIGGIAGGVAAPVAPAAGSAVVRGGARLAEEVGRANVGNALLPAAPARVARPLLYEGLTPAERRITGVKAFGKDLEDTRDYLYGPVGPGGARPGNLVSAEDTARIQQLEQDLGNVGQGRADILENAGLADAGGLRDLHRQGMLAQLERSGQDPTRFRFRGKGLDEVFQAMPESDQAALPRVDATGRELNDIDRLVFGLEQVRASGVANRSTSVQAIRREIDGILAKYAEAPPATGPTAQAGFGGAFGPGQVARGAAERAPMAQAPLSEIAAREAARISRARGAPPVAVAPPVAPPRPPSPPAQPPAPPAIPPAPPRVPPAGTVPPGPPSQPTLIPPGSPGVNDTLSQARAIVERDRPGIVNRRTDFVPGVKQMLHSLQPARDQPERMTAAWVGEGLAQGKVAAALQQTRIGHLAQLDEAFGKGASATRDFKPDGVSFVGTAEQAKYPYVGTLADIMARPSLYSLSPSQRAVLGAIQTERSAAFNGVKSSYGLDIGEFPAEPGGVHLPNVDIEETALAMAGGERGALLRGRTKARFYANAADRWAHDPSFRPETTVSSLLAANDSTLASQSGHRVLTEGLGGKTRLQVIQETHPELAAKMELLQKRLASVRATANRIGGKQAEAIDNFAQSPLDPADLATLQADLNPMVGADAVGRRGPNFGKDFKALKAEVAQAKAALAGLRPAWEVANLKPYVFVQEGIYRYFPVEEANQVKDLLKTSTNPVLRFVDNLRATAFGGDLSPISIQGVTAWLSDPIGSSRFWAQGKGGLTQAGMLADMKANPESWQRFTAATGINPLGGVDPEFATGFIGKIPKVGQGWVRWNEALYRPITRLQKDVFENSYQAALKHGLSPEQAMAVAGDDATKIIPRSNFRRLGQSQADAARYRAALTSVSFLTQPVALMNDAVKGLVKIGSRQTITPSERFAVKRVLTLVATVEAIAITSNVYHAQTHNLDVEQAVKDSLNPNSGKFMSLVLPNGARVGLGGPFRGIIRMVAPRQVEGVPVPLPFAGIERFAKGKLGPAIRIAYDEIRNRDYYGKPIRTENFPVNILQSLEYALEGSAPLIVGGAAAQVRRGEGAGAAAQETASQFLGTNYQPDDPAYAASVRWQGEFKEYRSLPTNAREAKAKHVLTRDTYRKRNPQIEAKLFIAGDISSLSTTAAKTHALSLMRQNNIKSADIESLAPRDYDSPDHIALRRYFAQHFGEPFVAGKTR